MPGEGTKENRGRRRPPARTSRLSEPRNILIVEDSLIVGRSLRRLFDRDRVHWVRSAADALIVLDRIRPDWAILDLELGDGLSLGLAHTLRAARVPFVFHTGCRDVALIHAAERQGRVVAKGDVQGLLTLVA
ncbi:MAG: hypothetical protein AAGA56_01690 [Myxococcota bacterium]